MLPIYADSDCADLLVYLTELESGGNLYKVKWPFVRGCPTCFRYEITQVSKMYNGLSWLHVSKPHPGTLGWKSMCSAVSSCPVFSNLVATSCSYDFGTSQIENEVIKNLKLFPAAYLTLSHHASFCAFSGTTSFSFECFPLAVAGQKIYTSYKLS